MPSKRRIGLCLLFIITACLAQEMEILARPIRPEKFTNHRELQDYLAKLKAYHLQNGQRYGKRFSPSIQGRLQPQFLPENWQDIYEILKHYNIYPNN